MFNFGTPEDNARIWLEQAIGSAGPGVELKPIEEMEQQELRDYFTYLRIAYFRASRNGGTDEAIEVIVQWYDEAFLRLLEVDEGFQALVCSRIHQPIRDRNEYWRRAGCGSAN